MKKRTLAGILAFSMCASMMAVPVQASGGDYFVPSDQEWWTPYDETVTLHVARKYSTDTDAYFKEGESLSNNIWTRHYLDKFNIEVVTDWISDEYDTKLNLAISSGELPDVFVVDNAQLTQLQEAGMIADLTEAYELYGSDTLKRFAEENADIFETGKKDGSLFGLAQYAIYNPRMLWIRLDWMKELGMEEPKTIEEFEKMLLGMKELSGSYALAVDQTLDTLYDLAIAWGAYPDIWVEDAEGKLVDGKTAPEMKEALATWAKWYEQGLLKEDFSTQDLEAVKEDLTSGTTGVITCESWGGWHYCLNMYKNLGGEGYLVPAEAPTLSGEPAIYPKDFAVDGYIVVNKDCENLEAVMKCINYYVYMNFDGYGVVPQEELDEYNNMAHCNSMFRIWDPANDENRHKEIMAAIEANDPSLCTTSIALECYNGTMKWVNEQDGDYLAYALQFGLEGNGMDIVCDVCDSNRVQNDKIWGADPDILQEYGSTLDDIFLEGFTKIIMGAESIEYFDELVEQWYAAGGQEVTDAVNEMYGR